MTHVWSPTTTRFLWHSISVICVLGLKIRYMWGSTKVNFLLYHEGCWCSTIKLIGNMGSSSTPYLHLQGPLISRCGIYTLYKKRIIMNSSRLECGPINLCSKKVLSYLVSDLKTLLLFSLVYLEKGSVIGTLYIFNYAFL